MMLPNNGFIEVEQTKGGGLVNGLPQKAVKTWSEKIPCHILENTEDNKGNYKDGKFKRYAFTIWFEMQEFNAKRVRLTDNRGRIKGEFEVQSIEFLELVQRVKISV